MFEKEAEEYGNEYWDCLVDSDDREMLQEANKDVAEFGYNKGKAETALLSQHILDLQKDKGNLTDRVRELEQQIEKMKCCDNCQHCGCGSCDEAGNCICDDCNEETLSEWECIL